LPKPEAEFRRDPATAATARVGVLTAAFEVEKAND
jgi:hypothetical protein